MELTVDEKDTINKVAAIIKMDKKEVEKVFRGLLIATDMNLYKNNNFIVIPFLARLGIRYRDILITKRNEIFTEVRLDATPSNFLYDEIDKIVSEEPTNMEDYLKKIIDSVLLTKVQSDEK